jgi:hypothetical protein
VSELLAVTSALFGSDGFGGGKPHAGVKPAAQHWPLTQGTGLASEVRKDRLGHVFRQVRIPSDKAEGGGVNMVQMALYQLGKGLFVALERVSRKQSSIRRHSIPIP